MKYEVRYWASNLSEITKLKSQQIIMTPTLVKLIESKKVNVMIQHNSGRTEKDIYICWIDNMRFQQR